MKHCPQVITYSLDQVPLMAHKLHALMPEYQIFTFTGPLGAGKTTLISCLLKMCGVQEDMSSPTFTYVNIYKNQESSVFYHFDLYRIQSLDDFMYAGFDEYLYQPHSWALIEWPEVIMPLLKKSVCHIVLDYNEDMTRTMKIIG